MAAPVLQFKRGLSANLPSLRAGEPGFSTDSYDFYVGLTSQSINNKFLTSSRFWTKETATTGSGVNLVEGTNNGSDFITLASPASVGAAVTYYFPPANGSASSVLTNNGSGVLSWASGSANPVFTGIATFSDTTDNTLGDENTGSVQFDGGVGIAKNLTVKSNLHVGGFSEFVGVVTFRGGTINIGDNNTDDINVGGEFISNLVPNIDNTHDLGITTQRWGTLKVVNIDTTNLTGTAATITTFRSTTGNFTTGNIVTGVTTNFTSTNATITNLTGTAGTITTFNSTNGTITNLTGTAATITTFRSTTGNFDTGNIVTGVTTNFTSTNGTITNLTGTAATITTFRSTTGNFTTGNIVTGVTTNFTSTNATITNLTSTNVSVSGLSTFTGAIDANGGADISGGETTLSSATVSDLTAERVVLAGTSGALQDSANLVFSAGGPRVGAGGINITGVSTFSTNLVVGGDLFVNGSTTQVNTTSLTVEDTLIELGFVDGVAPTSDFNKDLGLLLNYYSGTAKKAAVFWDDSTSRIVVAAEVSETTGVLTPSVYAAFEIGSLFVNDCAGASQVISCTGTTRSLENITIDGGSF